MKYSSAVGQRHNSSGRDSKSLLIHANNAIKKRKLFEGTDAIITTVERIPIKKYGTGRRQCRCHEIQTPVNKILIMLGIKASLTIQLNLTNFFYFTFAHSQFIITTIIQ